jgi:hypothetical protein
MSLPLIALIDERDDLQPLVKVTFDKHDSKEERFWKFHRANPHVYDAIVRMAQRQRQQGATRLSMKAIFEHLRTRLETRQEVYRLNNSMTAPFARLVMDQNPDLGGLFETRSTPHDTQYYLREARL